jgi:hypothetical protein
VDQRLSLGASESRELPKAAGPGSSVLTGGWWPRCVITIAARPKNASRTRRELINPAFPLVRVVVRGGVEPPAFRFQVNTSERCADVHTRRTPVSDNALGGISETDACTPCPGSSRDRGAVEARACQRTVARELGGQASQNTTVFSVARTTVPADR